MPKISSFSKPICAVLLLCALLLSGCAGSAVSVGPLTLALPQRPAGILLYADPGVTILRPGGGSIGYEPGIEVRTGDTIETANGQAVIDYGDRNRVVLNRRTRVRLGSIQLFLGEVFARIKDISTRGGGSVVTDELSASVEGTEYGVRRSLVQASGGPGLVQVYVRQGRVFCRPGGGASWSPVTVAANQGFKVEGDRAASAPRTVDARALSRWADNAERRLWKPRGQAINPSITPIITLPFGPAPTRGPRQPDSPVGDYRPQ